MKNLLASIKKYFKDADKIEISHKPNINKWSKKEILGHLIDSGINNLQRFTEIKFVVKPYKLRHYSQNELVESNDYQYADIDELSSLFFALNTRILKIIEGYSEDELEYKMRVYEDADLVTLRFWINDYVNHMEHHAKQILNK